MKLKGKVYLFLNKKNNKIVYAAVSRDEARDIKHYDEFLVQVKFTHGKKVR